MVISVAYFTRLGRSSAIVPTAFLEARQSGSVTTQDIVNLSNEFTANLQQINKLDKEGKYAQALDLTTTMVQKIPEMRTKATELSTELQHMTSALTEIKSEDARQAAVDSITNRMALISRLFSYSDYLSQLSQVLTDKFREVPNGKSVPELTQRINSEVEAVNLFNKESSEAMTRFDQIMASDK